LLIGIITGIVIIINSIISTKKDRNNSKLKYNLISILFVIIAIVSWVFNMGWLRFIMTFLAVPIIHTIAFIIINSFSLSYIDKSVKLKRYVNLSYITYLLGYLSLPDGGDVGPMYVFFGLIHNDIVANISYIISSISFIGNIVLFILQIVEIILQIAERKKKTI
jgi:hypothetical protein